MIQAGLLDQSLYNPHYRDIDYWDHLWQPTLLPGGWTSAAMILGFVGGHVVGSISAPTGVTEALFPSRTREPWLGRLALLGVLILFAVLLARWPTRTGWGPRHRLAVAAGALAATGVIAFSVDPIGDVPRGAKYATNATLLLLTVLIIAAPS